MVWLIITYVAIGFVTLIVFFGIIGWFIDLSRKSKGKKWQVGDFVKMSILSSLTNPNELHKLVGWNSDNIFIEENNTVHKCEWSHLEYNKSANWRENYEKCEKFMTEKPQFTSEVKKDGVKSPPTNRIIYGKPIETMNETECQVYLKRAIDEENFEAAEMLRQRLENFR